MELVTIDYKSIEGRPAFKQMLSDIENGLGIDYVLVYKLSRFGRNAADILNSLEHIQSFGVNLICIEEEEYILADGQHEAIISEELWDKAHEKREITGVKSPSKIGRDRAHLLSGILKCPKCGGPMYTNKHAWTNKDGTYSRTIHPDI